MTATRLAEQITSAMFTARPHAKGRTRQPQAGAGSRGVELRSSLDHEGIDAVLAAAQGV
jgi:hypothetical protein